MVSAENWWKLRNRMEERRNGANDDPSQFKSVSGWLHNVIVSKHADAMDAFPEPVILPREPGDRLEARMLSAVVPCILEQNHFEQVYDRCMWQKLKTGTAAYRVAWDGDKLNGLGDIAIERVDLLNLFWEPGVDDIQKSRYVFHTHLEDTEELEEKYPQLKGRMGTTPFLATRFVYDDAVSLEGKQTVVEAYYKRRGRLHYCKYVGDTVLYATESDPGEAQTRARALPPLCKGRWPEGPEGLPPLQGEVAAKRSEVLPPLQGEVAAKRSEVLPPLKGEVAAKRSEVLPPLKGEVAAKRSEGSKSPGTQPPSLAGARQPPLQGGQDPSLAGAGQPPLQGGQDPSLAGAQNDRGDLAPGPGLYAHGQYPFVLDPLFPVEGSPCGYGFVDLCHNAQAAIDLMRTALVKNTMVGATPRYFQRVDGSVNEEEFTDLSKALVHVSGNLGEDSLRQIAFSPMSGVYMQVLESTIAELRETTGNTETSTGVSNSGVTAASAIVALQEASGKGSRDSTRSSYQAFARIVELVIELIRQFYTLPRRFRITGALGQENFVSYSGLGLQPRPQGSVGGLDMGLRLPVFDVKVSAQKRNAYSRLSQNELAMQLYKLGLFDEGRESQAMACLSLMDFDGREELQRQLSEGMQLRQQLQEAESWKALAIALTRRYQPERLAALVPSPGGSEVLPPLQGEVAPQGAEGFKSRSGDSTRPPSQPPMQGGRAAALSHMP